MIGNEIAKCDLAIFGLLYEYALCSYEKSYSSQKFRWILFRIRDSIFFPPPNERRSFCIYIGG